MFTHNVCITQIVVTDLLPSYYAHFGRTLKRIASPAIKEVVIEVTHAAAHLPEDISPLKSLFLNPKSVFGKPSVILRFSGVGPSSRFATLLRQKFQELDVQERLVISQT